MSDRIKLHTTYHVTAYDESWGGYGDNASRDFEDEASAVEYARKIRSKAYPDGPRYEPIKVTKKITMDPIYTDISF